MYTNYILSIVRLLSVTLFITWLQGCSKYEDYKNYTTGKEIIYTGRADSVKAFSGRNRVLLTWLAIADQSVSSAKIFWNNKNDSISFPVKRSTAIDTIRVLIPNLTEGNHNFQIVTYDNLGNYSVTVNQSGISYGAVYENTLLNRLIKKAEKIGSDVQISWYSADASSLGTEITYEKNNGGQQKVLVLKTENNTVLPSYKDGSKFSFRTLYKPDSAAIDTFYSASQQKGVIADVTALYLKNSGSPFIAAGMNGGRWGNLADWVVNDAVKNHGGYGGYDNIPGYGTLSVEYWGTPAVVDGKIYQTATLEPGNYVFSAIVQNIDFELPSSYLSAAMGAGLPNIADYQSGLGFAKFTNNSQNGKDVSFAFTLASKTPVSLGLIATMNTGTQSLRVKGFKLVYNPD